MALPVSSLTAGAGALAPTAMESAAVTVGCIVRAASIITALKVKRAFFIIRQFVEFSSL